MSPPPPQRGQLPAVVQEKGQGAGLSGLLLWAVELCSFHGVVHKDPLAICRDRDSRHKPKAVSTPGTCLLSTPAPERGHLQPLIGRPDINHAPWMAPYQGAVPQPSPPALLGHGERVSTTRLPSLGRSPQSKTAHCTPNPAVPTSVTDPLPRKMTPQSPAKHPTQTGTGARSLLPAPRPPPTPGGWVGRRHLGVSHAQLHPS